MTTADHHGAMAVTLGVGSLAFLGVVALTGMVSMAFAGVIAGGMAFSHGVKYARLSSETNQERFDRLAQDATDHGDE